MAYCMVIAFSSLLHFLSTTVEQRLACDGPLFKTENKEVSNVEEEEEEEEEEELTYYEQKKKENSQ